MCHGAVHCEALALKLRHWEGLPGQGAPCHTPGDKVPRLGVGPRHASGDAGEGGEGEVAIAYRAVQVSVQVLPDRAEVFVSVDVGSEDDVEVVFWVDKYHSGCRLGFAEADTSRPKGVLLQEGCGYLLGWDQ